MSLANLTLVLGGARSGKSAYAEAMALDLAGSAPATYLATSQVWDAEMRARVDAHKAQRAGQGWITLEEPLELAAALVQVPRDAVVLVDCLTLWATNLMLAERDVAQAEADLLAVLAKREGACILVSNEVGLGIVPDNALARKFRDIAGRMNQNMAQAASKVVFVAAGLPMILKTD